MEAIRCPLADEWIKYIYTMEWYSAVEHIWVSSNEVDETGAYYTEWSKKEKHQYHILIPYIYMGFRKLVTMTLYVRQQKRHKCKEQIFGFCGRRWGWDDSKECWNMYITICEIDDQSKFNTWNRTRKAGALRPPREMGWGGSWEGGLGWGDTCAPEADSCQCMAKKNPPQYYKVVSD